ncbi:MAG: LysM peptidoglycan-binding domain-containing protein [Pseudomonadota bacterium]
MNSGLKGVFVFCAVGVAIFVAASGRVYDFNSLIQNTVGGQSAALLQSVEDEAADATESNDTQMAALPDAGSAEPATTEAGAEAPAMAATDDAAPANVDGEPGVPTFDILRVEPDGSTLVAGRAAPESEVEIVRGDSVIASTTANAAGEFVAVLEESLEIGDHSMSIRASGPEGDMVVSEQTAIVSIPEDQSEGVLAMVETPGEASRLISTPQAPGGDQLAASQTEQPGLLELGTGTPLFDGEAAATGEASELPGILALGEGTPRFEGAETGQGTQDAQTEIAAVEPQATTRTGSADIDVAIEAVEIDGGQVFVAGRADPGVQLRVYANEILLGDAVASEGGRFLVEVERELPEGEYTIRADVLNPQTAEVIRRAAVPFTRSAGERQAAIAAAPAVTLPDTAPQIEAAETAEAASTSTEAASTEQAASTDAASGAAETQVAAVETTEAAADGAIPTEVGTLTPTDGSVIIRRGDTLWQISRRVYGQGVKYTTIYLANQNQIQNPQRIWPGQVFDVPTNAQDAETAFEQHQQLLQQN